MQSLNACVVGVRVLSSHYRAMGRGGAVEIGLLFFGERLPRLHLLYLLITRWSLILPLLQHLLVDLSVNGFQGIADHVARDGLQAFSW